MVQNNVTDVTTVGGGKGGGGSAGTNNQGSAGGSGGGAVVINGINQNQGTANEGKWWITTTRVVCWSIRSWRFLQSGVGGTRYQDGGHGGAKSFIRSITGMLSLRQVVEVVEVLMVMQCLMEKIGSGGGGRSKAMKSNSEQRFRRLVELTEEDLLRTGAGLVELLFFDMQIFGTPE